MLRLNKTKTYAAMVLLAIPLPVLYYITFAYNPWIPVTLPMLIRIDREFTSNTTNINLMIGLLEKSTFTLSENLTLKRMIAGTTYASGSIVERTYRFRSLTTREYSSGQTIQLSVYKDGAAWGVIHNITLPSVHFRCMESRHRFNETRKFVVNRFHLDLDPTQLEPRLYTTLWRPCPHQGAGTNRVTFSKVETGRYPLTGVEAFYSSFSFVSYAYSLLFPLGILLLSDLGRMVEDKRLYPPSVRRFDVETQTKYPRDLFARYAEQYPHNPEGVLEWHIHKKMKEGKTREQAIKELAKESE